MKVKIGDTWYDGSEQPIMLVLTQTDRNNIMTMPEDSRCYAVAPRGMDKDKLKSWMREGNPDHYDNRPPEERKRTVLSSDANAAD